MAARRGWSLLFLSATSPGQVIRYLQRRAAQNSVAQTSGAPEELFLSDAVGPENYRAIVGPASSHVWMESIAPSLAKDFPPTVTHIWRTDDKLSVGGIATWNGDEAQTRKTFEESGAVPLWLRQFLVQDIPERRPEFRAAKRRKLPIERLTEYLGGRIHLVDYETIAALDRKGLLLENGKRLYRFDVRHKP